MLADLLMYLVFRWLTRQCPLVSFHVPDGGGGERRPHAERGFY